MIVFLRVLVGIVLVYMGWVIFRVVHDWLGLVMAIVSVVLLPISIPVVALAMLFVHSAVAGPLALWPGVVLFGVLDGIARKRGLSLLIKG
jgi:hypothetical protein